jgi:hypothetical protein
MKCVIICTCGREHKAQCSCWKKMYGSKGYKCDVIKVLPRCNQYFPKNPVTVIPNALLIRKGGEERIVKRTIKIPEYE